MGHQKLTIAVSLADYCFERTRTIGQMNLAIGLVKALATRPEIEKLVVLKNNTIQFDFHQENLVFIDCNQAIKNKISRIFWDQIGLYSVVKKLGVQWLILPKGFASFVRRPPSRLAVYIHDAVPDFYRTHYPKDYNRLEQIYFNSAMRASLKFSDMVFPNSEFVVGEVKRLCENWKIKPEYQMCKLGVAFEKPTEVSATKSGRLLVLVSKWRHKRSNLAIEFLKKWQQQTGFNKGIDFVGELPDGIAFPQFPQWRHYPRLPEKEYRELFTSSSALVYFSEYEGFGMPPVEAAINGVCPVYSDIPALREVMVGCGFSFNNSSYEDFSYALNSALNMPYEQIKLWEDKLLKLHNWQDRADKFISALTNVKRINEPELKGIN